MTFPKLSIIVPAYNPGAYIEETIRSIINQDYPNKELIIIDGGSTDNTVNIIKKYERYIKYWVSEKDEGQADAINKGFERATGDYIAWMNSDDIYYKDAFKKIFLVPGIEQYDFIHGGVRVGKHSGNGVYYGYNKKKKLRLYNLLHFFYSVDYIIPSQSVFVKRDFLKEHNIGFLNKDCHYCMDMEWYCRIALANAKQFEYSEALSFFRVNNTTKTGSQYSRMQREAIQIFLSYRKYLTRAEQAKIFNLLYLHRIMRALQKDHAQLKTVKLLKVLFKIPTAAIKDRRFLGLLKRSMCNK